MARHYHVELADHWRRDDHGRIRLSMRRLRVLIAHLPADSALVRAVDPYPAWSIGDVLLAHIWQAVANSKKPHPMLATEYRRATTAIAWTPGRLKVVAQARRRARQRRDDIAAGLIT